MELLQEYLDKNGYRILRGKEAKNAYKKNSDNFKEICGEFIFGTIDGYITTYNAANDVDDIILLLVNREGKATSIFYGNVHHDILTSDYTCSSELPKGGMLLRFYALLTANENNPGVTSLTGGISGGIPAIKSTDSEELVNEKRKKLQKYHTDNGATVEDDKFTYNLPAVQAKIVEIFGKRGGKKRKTKRRGKKNKKTRRYKR